MRLRGFIGGAYTLPSVAAECQRCVNLYPEINEAGTFPNGEKAYLRRVPGNKPYLTLPNSPVRGLYRASTGVLYAVGGNHLYEVQSTNTIVDRGTLLTSTGLVSMTDNKFQLCIVDGTYGYSFTLGSTTPVAQITSGAFYPGPVCKFQDGLIIVARKGTQEYHWSSPYDATAWNSLDYTSAEKSPDPLVVAIPFGSQLWLLGETSTEVHQNSGTSFEPIFGANFAIGCASAYCAQIVDRSLIWLDSSDNGYGVVWRATGLSPERISTHAIEEQLKKNPDLSGAYAWTYKDGGHAFYCMSVPYSKSTWCYDTTTRTWHERVSIDSHNREKVSRVWCHAFAYSKHFCGDSGSGAIYVMDDGYHFDGTYPLLWKRSSPHINEEMKRLFPASFELDADMGVGLNSGQGSSPVAFLRISKDRGHSWTNPIPASLGRTGETRNRAIWRRLGSGRDLVFEVSGSDPVPITILGAEVA